MPTITGVSHVDLSVTDLEASERWYTELLGLTRVMEGKNEAHHFRYAYLIHPTGLIFGLNTHDDGDGRPFDERRTGLDHLSFAVASKGELEEWAARLDELGIAHGAIAEEPYGEVLTFRDPDNIQVEFFHLAGS